jgi:hypothetical protein
MEDKLLSRMAGALGCDIVTGTSEFTARRGRIWCLISNAAGSGICDMTEEYPLSAINRKRQDTITLTGISGTATIVCNKISRTATFATDLSTTAANFVSANAAAYLAVGVVLTSVGSALIFKALATAVEFIADSSVTNLTTDLAGFIESTYVKNTATVTGRSYMSAKRVDTITLTGTSGTATILCDGGSHTATFNGTLTTTASDFVTANAAAYLAGGVVLTSSGANLIFTSSVAGVDFTGNTTCTNATGNLAGSVVATTANSAFAIDDNKMVFTDYPLTKFTPCAGSFWVFYTNE